MALQDTCKAFIHRVVPEAGVEPAWDCSRWILSFMRHGNIWIIVVNIDP